MFTRILTAGLAALALTTPALAAQSNTDYPTRMNFGQKSLF